ncbi:FHA domain-containing protein [Pseudonocardia humida]|uniref:FHA domain-containing protein n=1 Tax=Pseudonocardia humida TaxID=2800819 RepID=UPI00207CC0C3|nr:FHA domain-containing protein [Pseudonocardia humida]
MPGRDACPACRAPLQGRFCEECGHDNALPPPDPRPDERRPDPAPPSAPAPTGAVWRAVVRADRTWFDVVRGRRGPDVDQVEFPRYCPDRTFELTGDRMAIGRRSRSRGTDPEIDLSGPPLDPGVSAQHALLLARADGGWEVVDLDSTNGTSLGDSTALLRPHTPVRLADGDRIRLGAWTTVTIEVARPGTGPGQSR